MTHKENISTCPHCNNTGCDFCKKKENHLSKRELKIDNAIKAAITLMNSEKIKKRYPGGVSTMINMIRYALKSEFTPVLIHPSKSIFVALVSKLRPNSAKSSILGKFSEMIKS